MYSGRRICSPVPYPSTAISSFIGELKSLLLNQVYNKFEHVFIGSYNKAVQYIDQLNTDPDIVSKGGMYNKLPMLVFTPTLEQPVEQTDWLWNYYTMHPYMASWNRPPIMFEDGTLLTMTTRRMRGNIDIKILCESQPEEHDIHMAFLNYFRGLNSVLPMNQISMQFVLSDKIKMLTDDNEEIVLDLNHSNISHRLVKTTGRMEYLIPISATPELKLTNLSDASSFYGGNDFAEFALSGSIQYELEIPSLLTLQTGVSNVKSLIFTVTSSIVNTGQGPKDHYKLEEKGVMPDD